MNILQDALWQSPSAAPVPESERIQKIPICRILPNPSQPRKYFDSGETLRLADSIRLHGILQPLCVRRPSGAKSPETYTGLYELIAGERRLRAAKLLGLREVPCIVMEADSLKSAELAIIENLQRKDLTMFEEAAAIAALIHLYGLTQEQVAAKLSRGQSYVANKLRLLRYSEEEQHRILEKELTERHARSLLRLADVNVRRAALETVIARAYTVAETEEYVSGLLTADPNAKKPPKKRNATVRDIRIFYNTIDRAVDIMQRAGIDAVTRKKDVGDAFEVTVRIPKSAE